jgi:hypothetical protein
MFAYRSRKRFKEEAFAVTLAARGRLAYGAGGDRFLINALEGSGYGIVIEEMAEGDLGLRLKPLEVSRRLSKPRVASSSGLARPLSIPASDFLRMAQTVLINPGSTLRGSRTAYQIEARHEANAA